MDPLVDAALVGTARQANPALATGAPLDTLVDALPETSVERRLLLDAGALAVYRTAGRTAETSAAVPEPASAETQPPCTPAAAQLLHTLFGGEYATLLPEALERLRRAGRILPPELLTVALDTRDAEVRAALPPALGERGRWLARFNPAWRWAAESLAGDTLPDDAEAIWQEGSMVQRLAILRRLRAAEPARAREWLAAVWRQEKPEFRTEVIQILGTGLSGDDEAFLEAALDDRSSAVRAVAAPLLVRLPASALVTRMRARADAMLSWRAGKPSIKPPTALDPEAPRDGIVAKPPQGVGERAWWLTQTLALVAPAHWPERLGVSPGELLTAAQASEWAAAVVSGWAQATALHRDADWAQALWDWWIDVQLRLATSGGGKKQKKDVAALDVITPDALLTNMPAPEAEWRVQALFASPELGELQLLHLADMLEALPRPWSAAFGRAYLEALRAEVRALAAQSGGWHSTWQDTVRHAALALPPECFAAALVPWELPVAPVEPPEAGTRQHHSWATIRDSQFQRNLTDAFGTFDETLRLRQRLMEEIN